jgi:hypothetical protein
MENLNHFWPSVEVEIMCQQNERPIEHRAESSPSDENKANQPESRVFQRIIGFQVSNPNTPNPPPIAPKALLMEKILLEISNEDITPNKYGNSEPQKRKRTPLADISQKIAKKNPTEYLPSVPSYPFHRGTLHYEGDRCIPRDKKKPGSHITVEEWFSGTSKIDKLLVNLEGNLIRSIHLLLKPSDSDDLIGNYFRTVLSPAKFIQNKRELNTYRTTFVSGKKNTNPITQLKKTNGERICYSINVFKKEYQQNLLFILRSHNTLSVEADEKFDELLNRLKFPVEEELYQKKQSIGPTREDEWDGVFQLEL